jgi:hypothetical protein
MQDGDKDKKELSGLDKITSTSRAIGRIILGFFAFLLWAFLGVPPTLIYSSGIQTFIGTVSFVIKNPFIFLLVALINVLVGIVSYIYLQLLWYTAFHLLWSIRWFYGYGKYSRLKP